METLFHGCINPPFELLCYGKDCRCTHYLCMVPRSSSDAVTGWRWGRCVTKASEAWRRRCSAEWGPSGWPMDIRDYGTSGAINTDSKRRCRLLSSFVSPSSYESHSSFFRLPLLLEEIPDKRAASWHCRTISPGYFSLRPTRRDTPDPWLCSTSLDRRCVLNRSYLDTRTTRPPFAFSSCP